MDVTTIDIAEAAIEYVTARRNAAAARDDGAMDEAERAALARLVELVEEHAAYRNNATGQVM